MLLPRARSRPVVLALLLALIVTALGLFAFRPLQASAAPTPLYTVVGDVDTATGGSWGLHESYFDDLVSTIQNPANFGDAGTVHAKFAIGTPRAVPLTAHSLDNVDVYFLSGRDLQAGEAAVIDAFIARGGALVVSSNAPSFYDTTAFLGFQLSPRVVFGDGPPPYAATHRAPSPSSVVDTTNPIASGPFGSAATFDNWHTVAAFTGLPAGATAIAQTTLTGPDNNGSATNITISGTTLAAIPSGARGPESGPIVATSDIDTFSNAYKIDGFHGTADDQNTLVGTSNGTLARNTFSWIAEQLGGNGYYGVGTPARILDTRSGIGGPAVPFGDGEQRELTVTTAGVPTNADMVSINLTAVDPTAVGFLTAWPTGGAVPDVSNVNFHAGTTVANAALVKVGAGGRISIFNSAGSTNILVDVVGYTASGGSHLVTQNPLRIKDTRTGLGGAGIAHTNETQQLAVANQGGVPANATAVVLNVTAVDPTETAFVTVWPADQPMPDVSNINTSVGTTVANLVVVRLPTSGGGAGAINLFNAAGDTHLLVDVLGYFTAGGSGGNVTALTPHRIVDTRPSASPLGPGEVRSINPGVAGARAVVLNVTADAPTETAFFTVFPSDAPRPDTSNLNFYAGKAAPNLVIVKVGADGLVNVYNAAGSTQLIVDIVAAFD